MNDTEKARLTANYEAYAKRIVSAGGRVLTHNCPHCKALLKVAAPRNNFQPANNTRCPYCFEMFCRSLSPGIAKAYAAPLPRKSPPVGKSATNLGTVDRCFRAASSAQNEALAAAERYINGATDDNDRQRRKSQVHALAYSTSQKLADVIPCKEGR